MRHQCKYNSVYVSLSPVPTNTGIRLQNQDLSELYRVTILTDHYHVPLPLCLLLLTHTTHLTVHMHNDEAAGRNK